MSAQDDYFDLSDFLRETESSERFEEFAKWAFSLESELDRLRKELVSVTKLSQEGYLIAKRTD